MAKRLAEMVGILSLEGEQFERFIMKRKEVIAGIVVTLSCMGFASATKPTVPAGSGLCRT